MRVEKSYQAIDAPRMCALPALPAAKDMQINFPQHIGPGVKQPISTEDYKGIRCYR